MLKSNDDHTKLQEAIDKILATITRRKKQCPRTYIGQVNNEDLTS